MGERVQDREGVCEREGEIRKEGVGEGEGERKRGREKESEGVG